ncbi:iron-hydroxamate ABC transporter substrate-binding protein [Paenibacillus sp. XY044]|uniref:iron-hydroxamate ABC transporter substrate-binding protein n=1 Tax=Paenibacillus sp. XY044 TaxID=2026089 RepID=UPI00211B4A3B|nr:iron-hydroxamate ABC transporter substrate-binding protein [Paenibacillus sp. XY044]
MFKFLRPYTLIMCVLGIALLLGACGSSGSGAGSGTVGGGGEAGSSSSAEASASQTGGQESSGTGKTVTFHAGNGDVQVPEHPQRIVDLTNFYTGYFLELGVKPVGILEGAMENPYFEGMLDGVESIGNEPSPEKILSLKPDLIITYTGTDGIDKLEQIAPVVAIEYGKKNYKDQMIDFGKLTGKEAEAKAWAEQWENKIDELKPKIQEAVGSKTVSILNPYAKGLYVFGHNYGRGGEIIYGEFGLKAPPEAQKEAIDSGTGWATISMETLPEFAGDIIFTCPWSGDTSDPNIVYDNPVWKSLPAVKAGHVFQLNPKADTYNDPVSLEAQLKFISDSLLSVK